MFSELLWWDVFFHESASVEEYIWKMLLLNLKICMDFFRNYLLNGSWQEIGFLLLELSFKLHWGVDFQGIIFLFCSSIQIIPRVLLLSFFSHLIVYVGTRFAICFLVSQPFSQGTADTKAGFAWSGMAADLPSSYLVSRRLQSRGKLVCSTQSHCELILTTLLISWIPDGLQMYNWFSTWLHNFQSFHGPTDIYTFWVSPQCMEGESATSSDVPFLIWIIKCWWHF